MLSQENIQFSTSKYQKIKQFQLIQFLNGLPKKHFINVNVKKHMCKKLKIYF